MRDCPPGATSHDSLTSVCGARCLDKVLPPTLRTSTTPARQAAHWPNCAHWSKWYVWPSSWTVWSLCCCACGGGAHPTWLAFIWLLIARHRTRGASAHGLSICLIRSSPSLCLSFICLPLPPPPGGRCTPPPCRTRARTRPLSRTVGRRPSPGLGSGLGAAGLFQH